MDQLTTGLWMDNQSTKFLDGNCTIASTTTWVPTTCRPPAYRDMGDGRYQTQTSDRPNGDDESTVNYTIYRVGDSTMAPVGGNVGGYKWNLDDPFVPTYGYGVGNHEVYLSILTEILPNNATANDVLVLGHGLHPIAEYNVDAAVDVVLRMLCQLALTFPGKMILQGPVPIQQQQFSKVDIIDMNVNLVKEMLRDRILSVDGRLADVCRDIPVNVFSALSTKMVICGRKKKHCKFLKKKGSTPHK
jgi:hypothetical protein